MCCWFSHTYFSHRKRSPAKQVSPKAPYIESPDINIKPEAEDSSSFLSTSHPQNKNKKQGQPIATIEILSDEDDNATPTPKANRMVPSTPLRSNMYVLIVVSFFFFWH